MTVAAPSYRIAVADDEPDMRQFFQELLRVLGHEVVSVAETGKQLVEQCRTSRPELVITDIKMPDMDGLAALAALEKEKQVPAILVSAHHDADYVARAGTDHVMAYLIKPVKPVDLQAAISLAMLRFEHFQKLSREAASLRQALEDRKIIERAKGSVMKRVRVDEGEAFRRLQKLASDQNAKLIEIAHRVITSEEVFHQLDRL
jgi:AmiR/NasT family two-component response regulator